MDSRFATFGRRMVIISAVFGLTTVGGAGGAQALDPVGYSPSAKVVARAPMAVSVTFAEPLRADGAVMRILTDVGDVGTGEVTTGQKTLRRDLRLGAPHGRYEVEWTVYSAKGQKRSGKFSFTAGKGNGPMKRTSPVPSPPVVTEPAPEPTATQTPDPTPTPDLTAEAVVPVATPEPSGTPEWIAGSDPLWTAQASGESGPDREVSTGFTAVPLTVGGLLVLAAGVISLINRPRLRR
jgi:methionine-rich copper-binding protein CopC